MCFYCFWSTSFRGRNGLWKPRPTVAYLSMIASQLWRADILEDPHFRLNRPKKSQITLCFEIKRSEYFLTADSIKSYQLSVFLLDLWFTVRTRALHCKRVGSSRSKIWAPQYLWCFDLNQYVTYSRGICIIHGQIGRDETILVNRQIIWQCLPTCPTRDLHKVSVSP